MNRMNVFKKSRYCTADDLKEDIAQVTRRKEREREIKRERDRRESGEGRAK